MCTNVVLENKCEITQRPCPFMYWCDKTQSWRANNYMPKQCKVAEQTNAVKHKGKYQVKDCRKGYLYVDIKGITYRIKNPFDFVPDYVDVVKRSGVYTIKK